MTTYLKPPNPQSSQASDALRRRVSDILRDIEHGGLDAVRRWSRDLDGWAPDTFVVPEAGYAAAEAELARRAQGAHRLRARPGPRPSRGRSARRCRTSGSSRGRASCSATGTPGRGGRRLRARRALPDARVLVHDDRGGEGRGRRAGRRRAPRRSPAAASTRRCCTRCATSGADVVLALGGVQALAAMAFGLVDGAHARRHARRRRQRVRRRGQAAAVRARRHRPARRTRPRCSWWPTRPPTRDSSPPTCSARPSTGRARPSG